MSNARDRQLDGLRTFAVTMVLYAHFLAADGSLWGHLGVRLFFVLSGKARKLIINRKEAYEASRISGGEGPRSRHRQAAARACKLASIAAGPS